MAEESKKKSPESTALPATPVAESNWKLPDGIENHIETGLIKAAVGMAVGGVAGLIFFRGGASRAASVAAGLGVAAGSTFERIQESYK